MSHQYHIGRPNLQIKVTNIDLARCLWIDAFISKQHIASGKYIGINHNGKLISKSRWNIFLQWFFFRTDFYPSLANILTLNQLQYDSDCTFKEGIFANYWTTYSSLTWGLDRMQLSTWYMAINGRGHRVSAKNSKKSRPSAHFLPDPIEGKLQWKCTLK